MTERAEVRLAFEMRGELAEVTTTVDLGDGLAERHGPYLLTENADVLALLRHVTRDVAATALAFLARTGAEVCEERIK